MHLPHRASHSSTGDAGRRNPATGSRATRSAWVVLGAGLTRHPPLSLLSSRNCSHRRRNNIRPTGHPHNASSDRSLIARGSPFPTHAHAPPGGVSRLSPGPAGNPSLVGECERVKGGKIRIWVRLAAKGRPRLAEVIRNNTALKLRIRLRARHADSGIPVSCSRERVPRGL